MISSVQIHDAGRYTCICHTDNGQQFLSEYELNVEEEPLKNEVRPAKVEYAEVGSTTVLKCSTDRHPIRYHWSRQHGQFPSGLDINGVSLILLATDYCIQNLNFMYSSAFLSHFLIHLGPVATHQCSS